MSSTADHDEAGHANRRRRVVVAGTVAIVSLAVSAAVSASARTPAQHAADRAPAAPKMVTVNPTLRELRDVRIAACTLEVAQRDLGVPGAASTPRSVFTAVDVTPGQHLEPGRRVAEISGRPVIALDLPFPLYRDLRPLDTGPDVAVFQEALVALGRLATASGTVDRATQSAVQGLYEDLGATPPRTGAELDLALTEAQATESELAARAAAGETLPNGALRAAVQARQLAQSRIGTMVPMGEILAAPSWTVHHVPAAVGATATEGEPIVVVQGASSVAVCSLSAEAAAGVTAGMPATLVLAGAEPVRGVVGDVTFADGAVTLSFSAALAVSASATGASGASLEVVVATSDGPVLAVPAGVLREGADGIYVEVPDGDKVEAVAVTVGFIADGWVELSGSDLDESSELVVEQDPTAS